MPTKTQLHLECDRCGETAVYTTESRPGYVGREFINDHWVVSKEHCFCPACMERRRIWFIRRDAWEYSHRQERKAIGSDVEAHKAMDARRAEAIGDEPPMPLKRMAS